MSEPNESQPERPFSAATMLSNMVLLPGLIVLGIVLAALVFVWITQPSGDVDSLVESLATPGRDRWSAALQLAAVLHEPGEAPRRCDRLLAGRLAEILQKEIDAAGMDEESLRLREYLCRALGEFEIAEPLPVLITAAKTQRDPKEARVQCAAIQAVAVLADNVSRETLLANPKLLPCLVTAAGDESHRVRCSTAYTLGVLGGDEAEASLETLLADEYPEVRYNAATGLARHGNVACVDVLLAMLDPSQPESSRGIDRRTVQLNALRATKQLVSAGTSEDLSKLTEVIEALTNAGIEMSVRVKALEVLESSNLGKRSP